MENTYRLSFETKRIDIFDSIFLFCVTITLNFYSDCLLGPVSGT